MLGAFPGNQVLLCHITSLICSSTDSFHAWSNNDWCWQNIFNISHLITQNFSLIVLISEFRLGPKVTLDVPSLPIVRR
jgi:hypothetical protein